MAPPICRRLLTHLAEFPFSIIDLLMGTANAANTAMIAMTTSNSISVNACFFSGALFFFSIRWSGGGAGSMIKNQSNYPMGVCNPQHKLSFIFILLMQ